MTEPSRRLVAIMFTDIAGYTALMGRDEGRAVRALRSCRQLVRAQVEAFHGTLLEEIGDGALASFDSAVGAVQCAHAIQQQVATDPDYELHIGIHIGDVLVSGSQVLGDGVNVASRIHGLADPGGICISDRVYDDIRNHSEFQPRLLGERELKNVNRRVTVYVMGAPGTAAAPVPGRRRRRWWVAAAAVAAVLLVAAVTGVYQRVAIAALVNVPRVLADDLDQQIGFATSADGTRIAYAVTGSGPPLVSVLTWLTHVERGLGSPIYNPAVSRWSEHHTYVRYDGRGFGLSDRNATDFSVATRLADLEAVIDALGFDRVSLIGLSAGGPITVAYAVAHPEKVEKIVLLSSTANADRVRRANPMLDQIPGLLRTGWVDGNAAAKTMFSSIFAPEAGPLQRQFLHELIEVAADDDTAARFFEQISEPGSNVDELLGQVQAPTLIVHTDGDLLIPIESGGRDLAARIPGSRLVVLESNNHGVPASDPAFELMMHEIEAFLAE